MYIFRAASLIQGIGFACIIWSGQDSGYVFSKKVLWTGSKGKAAGNMETATDHEHGFSSRPHFSHKQVNDLFGVHTSMPNLAETTISP